MDNKKLNIIRIDKNKTPYVAFRVPKNFRDIVLKLTPEWYEVNGVRIFPAVNHRNEQEEIAFLVFKEENK